MNQDQKLDKILQEIQKLVENVGEGKLIIFIKESEVKGIQTVTDIKLA